MDPVALLRSRQMDGRIRGEVRTKVGDRQLSSQCDTWKIVKGNSCPSLQHQHSQLAYVGF